MGPAGTNPEIGMLIFFSLILILFLLFLSFFFSGAEAALSSLSKYKIRKITALQKPLRKIFSKWLQYPQDFLTTILVGNAVSNILVSSIATFIAIQIFDKFLSREIIEFAAWLFITAFIITFCDIVPKMYGKSNPERMSLLVITPIGFINKIIYPLIKPFIWFAGGVLGIKSARPVSKINSITAEEVRNIVLDSGRRGILGKETTKMLEGMLKLSKIRVSEIMVPIDKVESVNIDNSSEKIMDDLLETGRSRVPVYSGSRNRIIGIVLLKDLVNTGQNESIEFSKSLIRPAHFVTADEKVSKLLSEFRKGTSHCAIVIDYKNDVKGFLTLEDVLEEIVGEIIDEYELAYGQSR